MKSFGDLTKEEKMTLVAAWIDGEDIEHFCLPDQWHLVKQPSWQNNAVYRVVDKRPQIDWSHVSPEYNWLAMDEDGDHWLYEKKPSRVRDGWSDVCGMTEPHAFRSFKKGNCDWKESLIGRDKK